MTHHEKAKRGFTKGSSTYPCRCCKRLTRSTGNGDNENVKLCVECWDIAGIENAIEDGHYTEAEMPGIEAEMEVLRASIVAKGGNPDWEVA